MLFEDVQFRGTTLDGDSDSESDELIVASDNPILRIGANHHFKTAIQEDIKSNLSQFNTTNHWEWITVHNIPNMTNALVFPEELVRHLPVQRIIWNP